MLRKLCGLSLLAILALGGCASVSIPFVGGVEPAAAPVSDADRAIAGAYARMADDVREVWGDRHMEMPSDKAFVYYEDGMAARTIMDFAAGELRVERVLEPNENESGAIAAMRTSAAEAIGADTAELARKDTLMRYVAEEKTSGAHFERFEATEPAVEDAPLLAALVAEPAEEVRRMTVQGADGVERRMIAQTIPFSPGFYGRLAARYADDVMAQARAHEIAPSLILAVIETESAFNPRAMSPIPAFGLMQIVPTSAGLDASGYLTGEPRLLRPEELYRPDANIELGTVYLKLLFERYLRPIENPQSRLHGVVAAYNTGAGNVARSFTGKFSVNEAANIINAMAPDEVLAHLQDNLPFEETRRYIVKVNAARENYRDWDAKL